MTLELLSATENCLCLTRISQPFRGISLPPRNSLAVQLQPSSWKAKPKSLVNVTQSLKQMLLLQKWSVVIGCLCPFLPLSESMQFCNHKDWMEHSRIFCRVLLPHLVSWESNTAIKIQLSLMKKLKADSYCRIVCIFKDFYHLLVLH